MSHKDDDDDDDRRPDERATKKPWTPVESNHHTKSHNRPCVAPTLILARFQQLCVCGAVASAVSLSIAERERDEEPS